MVARDEAEGYVESENLWNPPIPTLRWVRRSFRVGTTHPAWSDLPEAKVFPCPQQPRIGREEEQQHPCPPDGLGLHEQVLVVGA